MTTAEEWRDIPGLEGRYQASSLGRIRSLPRSGKTCYGAQRQLPGRVLSCNPSGIGYVRVNIDRRVRFAHRLVAAAFIDNPNNLPEVNHIDGNKGNCRPENLEWCTRRQNMAHAFATGLAPIRDPGRGDNSIAAKLSEAEVARIKARLRRGDRSIDVAREHSVCKSTIGEIKAGRSWSHIQ